MTSMQGYELKIQRGEEGSRAVANPAKGREISYEWTFRHISTEIQLPAIAAMRLPSQERTNNDQVPSLRSAALRGDRPYRTATIKQLSETERRGC